MTTQATEMIRVSPKSKEALDSIGSKNDSYEDIIARLLAEKGIAPCRYCGKMRILDTDGLCQPCAQLKEAGA